MIMKTFAILVFLLTGSQKNADAVNRPRGVEISKMSFYAGEAFTCLDGTATISMDWVNDDYCDCRDGSDEPGTSACANGQFNCKNAGYKSYYIPSSRVNDGICDCCDGSDEFSGLTLCEDNCRSLGQAMREADEKKRLLLTEGYKVFEEYTKQGQSAKDEGKGKLETLETERMELEGKLEELKKAKEDAETPENEAKDKHQKAWEEAKAEREAELDKIRANTAFQELDTNSDSLVSEEELLKHSELDKDLDGEFTPQEAKEYLEDNAQVDFDTFHEKVWPNIKQIYKRQTPDEEGEPGEKEAEEKQTEEEKPTEEEPMPEYDENTKALIDIADKARQSYNDVNNRVNEIKRELDDIQKLLQSDYGPKDQFYPLKNQCFEYTDREYIYKMCPFDRASQRSKNGGGDTSLGHWGEWAGPDHDKYTKQKYTGGQNCWNGPDRSVVVIFHCGLVNELTSASEPSRCEYSFDFNTPASCDKIPQPAEKDPNHDEL